MSLSIKVKEKKQQNAENVEIKKPDFALEKEDVSFWGIYFEKRPSHFTPTFICDRVKENSTEQTGCIAMIRMHSGNAVQVRSSPRYCKRDGTFKMPLAVWLGR